MKKFLSMLLALVMLLAVAAPVLADEDVPTVSYYVRGGTAEYEPYIYPGLVGLLKIQSMAGVNVDWTVVCGSGDEISAQYLAMLASGSYPDIIQWQHNNSYTGGVSQLYADGIIIELNDVIDKYMPNYKALLDANPQIAKTLMDDEGRYLYFTVINPLNTNLEKVDKTWWGLMMRQDWLDNVGMEAPTTMDEWYDVLTAFKEGDPNGNGEMDEIPFDAGAAGHNLFLPAFDIMSGVYINPETGKVAYGQYTQNYKAYLETMNKWYAEGLLQNIWNEDGSLVGSDVTDSNIYADLSGSWKGLSNYWEQRLPQLLEKNPNADFVAVQWVKDEAGNFYGGYTDFSYGDRHSVVISVDCQNVEAAARLIDQMFTEEGTNATTWGTMDGDPVNPEWTGGKGTYYIDENGNKKETEWANQMTENFYDGAFANKYRYAMSHVSFPRWGAADYLALTREERYVNSAMMWAEADNSLAYPAAIVLSTDAQKAAVPQLEDIGTYINEMTQKFIKGEEPLTMFDTYMDTLQKMGIEDLIALYQQAYDSFNARGN